MFSYINISMWENSNSFQTWRGRTTINEIRGKVICPGEIIVTS